MDYKKIISSLNKSNNLCVMVVCGTHTMAYSQSGLRGMLSPHITMLSGPGCPVCVTSEGHIDAAIELINKYDVILASFGDMMRVKGSYVCLNDLTDKRKNIVIPYSPLDVLNLAEKNKNKQIVFFAVGFETTAPLIALAVKAAKKQGINNLSFLTSIKLMPPILIRILSDNCNNIDGIICPGHVASVKGANYFRFISEEFDKHAVICGFEALDILAGLHHISRKGIPKFKNLYKTCVNEKGNALANNLMQEVFETDHVMWRGIGLIVNSALVLNDKYSYFNAEKRFNIQIADKPVKKECNCKDVLLGNMLPNDCSLFRRVCNPDNPKGPCMVSSEGACSIFYRYKEQI